MPAPLARLSQAQVLTGRVLLSLVAVLLAFAVPVLSTAAADVSDAAAEKPPNIIILVVDTLRQDHLGCYGYFRDTTPQIDSLAEAGVRFAQAVTVMPHTLPTHISLFTSRYPAEHGVMMNGEVYDGRYTTLAEILANDGYATAAFVGAHPLHSKFGIGKGFQTYHDFDHWKTSADHVTRESLDWLETHAGTPFFLWLNFYDPHVPYSPPERLREKFAADNALKEWAGGRGTSSFENWADVFDRTTITHIRTPPGQLAFFKNLSLYDAEVAFADEAVGQVISALDDKSLLDRSLVVLLSDHGEGLGDHDFWFHGLHLYEEQVLIPLVFRFPGAEYAGRVVESQTSILDVMPTILDFLDLEEPDGVRGDSLMNLMTKERRKRPTHHAFSESRVYPPKKPRGPAHWTKVRRHSVRTPRWKLVRTTEGEEILYDLNADPEELADISASNRKQTRRLGRALTRWLASIPEVLDRAEPELSEEDREKLKSLGYID